MSTVTDANFVRLLAKGLKEVGENVYNELPKKIPEIFNVTSSKKAWEEYFNVSGISDFQPFNGQISYVGMYPGYYRKVEHKEYALGISFERKFIDDNQYNVMRDRTGLLMTSAHRTREKEGVRPFNYAFSSAFDYMESEEAVALCSSSHTTKTGASTSSGFDNSGTSAMSKTSIAATRLLMRQFRNDMGERIDVGDDLEIICSDALSDLAHEVTGTPKGYETANHTKNMDYQRYSIMPLLRLDDYSTTNWFMTWKSQRKKDLIWFDRIKPETQATVDFDTFITKVSGYYRNSWMFKDWRWCYGHNA